MPEMFKGASSNTFHRPNFINQTVVEGRQNETDLLLQHCALPALLDSSERMDPARCHPQTRDAVIDDIMTWIEDRDPEASMMIMHGPAGSGKSALAQSIAERCKLRRWLAAAFFFSRTAPGRNNGHSLIPTIVYQLMTSLPEVRRPIRRRLRKDPTLLKKSIKVVTEDLLIAPFSSWICTALCWITGKFLLPTPRVIVIDGLDECADNEIQSHILRAAAIATRRLPRQFRILIACRPEIHIMQTLEHPTINYVELDLGTRNASQDIQLFLSDKFEELKQHHPLAKHGSFSTSWPGSDIIDKITENASGQFIYANVIMAYIESPKHSPVDRLNVILGSSPKPDGDKPFATLDALYKHIFSSVEDLPLMRQILGFMVIPRTEDDGLGQYTTPTMIAKLLSPVSVDSILLVLEQLRSVISSAGPDKPIKFWHASISDFLLDKARSEKLSLDIQMAHEALARGYLCLFQNQRPDLFLESYPDFFATFLEHCKRAHLSERLQQDLIAYDFFFAYKTAVGEPITLRKLWSAWESERAPELFRTLELYPQGHSIVDIYIDGLYSNYPLEPCVKESLESFLDSKTSKKIETAIYHALYVPLMHGLLNGEDAATVTSLAEKCTIGILRAHSEATDPPFRKSVLQKWFRSNKRAKCSSVSYPGMSRSEFNLACNDCLSILLPHASYYSRSLVNLLLEQQRKPSPLFGIRPKTAVVGPYLEQFEDHVGAPPELKVFLRKYRASKLPRRTSSDGPTTSTTSLVTLTNLDPRTLMWWSK